MLLACGWLSAGSTGNAARSTATGQTPAIADTGSTLRVTAPTAPAPAPELPFAEASLTAETGPDPEAAHPAVLPRLRRAPWVALVPLWRADALRWQRLEPSLRLNPGHAPPYA
ncbi:hypothetical protein [Stenotrophomonas rhizophila]|uniref:hypothetical protein n=1 Tax=Stenotrophomonas rhizophila TaxID=216778 RepID=UPI0011CDF821|nr:hypothetical protein [Stenotrophomonas rhizophila]